MILIHNNNQWNFGLSNGRFIMNYTAIFSSLASFGRWQWYLLISCYCTYNWHTISYISIADVCTMFWQLDATLVSEGTGSRFCADNIMLLLGWHWYFRSNDTFSQISCVSALGLHDFFSQNSLLTSIAFSPQPCFNDVFSIDLGLFRLAPEFATTTFYRVNIIACRYLPAFDGLFTRI
jgi:hypothetical protein